MVNIYQYLGGITYTGNSVVSVLPASESKIRQGANLKKVRAGHLKEVSQKLIGCPLLNEVGEVIEDIADLAAAFFDDAVHLAGKIVEPGGGVDSDNFQALTRLEDGAVGGEAQVNAVEPVVNRLFGEGAGEVGVVLKAVDLPDDVIAGAQSLEKLIERGQAASDYFRDGALSSRLT
jgi:hypothetical protein